MKISATAYRLLAGLAATATVVGTCLASAGAAQAIVHSNEAMPNANSSLCLGSELLNTPGAALAQSTCTYLNDQLWGATQLSPNHFAVRDGYGLCMDIQGASTAQNAAVVLETCNGSASQQWRLSPGSHSGSTFDSFWINANSGLCLTIPNGSKSSGVFAVQATCQSTNLSQEWGTEYYFGKWTDVNSGQCIGVGGALTTAGAAVVQWPCNGSPDQTWSYSYISNLMSDSNSGMCLDVTGASTAAGAAIVQEPCQGGLHQFWTYTDSGQFVNRNSGMCLGVLGASQTAGTDLVQWPCNNSPDQSWNAR